MYNDEKRSIEAQYGDDVARIFEKLEPEWEKKRKLEFESKLQSEQYRTQRQKEFDVQLDALKADTEKRRQERLMQEEQAAKADAEWEAKLDHKLKLEAYGQGEMAYCWEHSKELEPLHDRCQTCTRFVLCWDKKVKELIHNAKK